MIEQAEVLSPWVEDPESPGEYIWGVQIDHPGFLELRDLTVTPSKQIPPDPNSVLCLIISDSVILDAIDADPNYILNRGTRMLAEGFNS